MSPIDGLLMQVYNMIGPYRSPLVGHDFLRWKLSSQKISLIISCHYYYLVISFYSYLFISE